MGKKTVIHDTADLIVRRKSDGHTVLNAHMQLAGLEQSISEEFLKGGIGNKNLFLIRTDKEVTLNTRSATFDMEYLAMTQGVEIDEAGTAVVTKTEELTVVDNAGTLEVTVAGTPVNNEVIITGLDGENAEATAATGVVAVPVGSAVAGDTVTVMYQEEVTGRVIEMDSTKFAEKYEVEMRTIEYDVDTAQVVADIYFIFPEVIPSGAFSLSLENGTAYTPEMNFMVMNPKNSDVFGKIVEVARA